MNVLEGLYAARASIDPGSFDFGNWSRCTCGHIYGGAHGALARDQGVMLAEADEGTLYHAMLSAVADANGLAAEEGAVWRLRAAISEATAALAGRFIAEGDHDCATREAAVLLITNAIEKLEAEQMAALLEVKAASPSLQEPREAVEA